MGMIGIDEESAHLQIVRAGLSVKQKKQQLLHLLMTLLLI